MSYIYWLSQIQSVERSLVGDKLFIFSQLLQHECPILPGFVLSNDLWREFIVAIGDRLSIKDCPDDDRQRQAFANHSRQIVEQVEIPSVWQSEIWTAAQQLNSACLSLQPFLTNTYGESLEINSLLPSSSCNCTPEAINRSIKSIWLELFSATSLIYRQKLGLTCDRLNLSILVRPLKNAYASGTVAIDEHFMQIKATWGLEPSLIWGDVETDEYYLDRDLGQIISQSLGQKNYAYRSKVESTVPINDCLEAYLPPAELATAYVLDPEAIAQLHQLTQDILRQQPQIKYLVWTAFKSTANNTLQFYWTQISDLLMIDLAIADKLDNQSGLKTPLMSGIALSPGTFQSEVVVIPNLDTQTQTIKTGTILVTKAIDPQHIALIKQVKGIITEVGGRNSHAGIVARELNIPAIANVEKATEILKSGDRILLDGDRGRVYDATAKRQTASSTYKVLTPTYPIATKLMVNLSQPESIPTVSRLPLDGVGLLRSELMLAELLATKTLAQWQESFQRQFVATLCSYLRQFGTAFTPRPVFYRSLDLYARSNNPLGVRGTYSYLSDPTLFNLELEALQTVISEGYHNLNLLLPFVRSVNEFQFCYRRLQQLDLTSQNSFRVWIMAEVPSVVMLLPEYVRAGVQGIAIGTNDLTQLLLGVDREQIQFSDRGLNANHPAVHRTIAKLIETAHQHDIECCICGQAPVEHPDLVDRLIEWGIDTISVEPDAVAQTYKAIARAEKRLLLRAMENTE